MATVADIAGYRVDAVEGPVGRVERVVATSAGHPVGDSVIVVDLDRIDLGVKRAIPGSAITKVDHDAAAVGLSWRIEQVAAAPEVEADLTDTETLLDKVVRHYFG